MTTVRGTNRTSGSLFLEIGSVIERCKWPIIATGSILMYLQFTPASLPVVTSRAMDLLPEGGLLYWLVILILFIVSVPVLVACCYLWFAGAARDAVGPVAVVLATTVIEVELLRLSGVSIGAYNSAQYSSRGFLGLFGLKHVLWPCIAVIAVLAGPYLVVLARRWTRSVAVIVTLTIVAIIYLYLSFRGLGTLWIPHEYLGV